MVLEIRRGTTGVISYELPFSADRLVAAFITIQQKKENKIEKTLEDMVIDGNVIAAMLTQGDALKLDSASLALVQLRIKDENGQTFDTDPTACTVGMLLKDGVI